MKFPAEIISLLAVCCSDKQLASLAVVNNAFKIEAERILYRAIALYPVFQQVHRALRCLETLKSCPEKARLVRSFSFNFTSVHEGKKQLRSALCRALPVLTSLKHLNLAVQPREYGPKLIPAAIRRSTFQLLTLRFPYGLDLISWASGHSSLTSIAIDNLWPSEISRADLALLRGLLSPHPSCPLPRSLSSASREGTRIDTIVVFPALISTAVHDSHGQKPVLPWSAEPIQKHFTSIGWPSAIRNFYVYLTSLSDESTLRTVLESIPIHFPDVTTLCLRVEEKKIHMYPAAFPSLLASFKQLETLFIELWDSDVSMEGYYQDRERGARLAENWALECRTLREVGFPGGVFMVPSGSGGRTHWHSR